nr:HNH endonuclease signature motif containing protein [Serinicoccus sp. CNJ-927]
MSDVLIYLLRLADVLNVDLVHDVIPALVGEKGQILDLGRAKRLVTPGQRRALAHRDGGCTFPGCHVPATWCDAHHVVHWARGGPSDLSNYALLCPRHHTWVHQHDTTADVDATGVRWRLR